MVILGYIASLLIGVSLGLVGAGGSILTMPVMVYLFHVPVLIATSYSLFIVGMTSAMGTYYQARQDNVNVKIATLFSLVSLTIVFLIRHYILPVIPHQLFKMYGVPVTLSLVSMLLFAILMVTAAIAMVRQKQAAKPQSPSCRSNLRLFFCGIMVGLITGFLGAGGGFILIPSLVLLLRLPMKSAIGTSLLIIALNSLFGFAVDLEHLVLNWKLLGFVTLFAIGGVFLGMILGKRIAAGKLKVTFGWMLMAVGTVILVKEMSAFLTKI